MGLLDTERKVAEPEDIQDIDLSATRKKRIRINGDNSKILELNTADLGIMGRVREAYPKLLKMVESSSKEFENTDIEDDKAFDRMIDTLGKIDEQMRKTVDAIFDANVSEVCASDGSMYDPFDGKFRFEHIIEALLPLYGKNLNLEFNKMSTQMKSHTAKYTGIK